MLQFLRRNRRRGPATRTLSIRQHLVLALAPLVGASLATAAWYPLYQCGWHMSDEVTDIIASAIVLQAAIFAIAAAMVLNGTWERVRAISRHVLHRNERGFMELREEKMPISMHFILLVSGLSTLALLSAAPYPKAEEGMIVIFLSWLVMLMYFAVVSNLQNITRSPWMWHRIPKHWRDQDVDTYFKTGFTEGEKYFSTGFSELGELPAKEPGGRPPTDLSQNKHG
jgi:hypothetical protein